MSRVLVINSGSSSLKYRLFDRGDTIAQGVVQRIGEPGAEADSHDSALRGVLPTLDLSDLTVVGHRVVHGGPTFRVPVLIDHAVVAAIEELVPLAPLHNPANLAGIRAARALLPDVPQVAVFDTAFHHTLPPAAATYAIDRRLAQRHGIRRFGFHGISHAYVARRTAQLIGRAADQLNAITLHLGNGASACAVAHGRSVATSMGLTPLEGLVMGTRSGDMDPAVIFHLHRAGGMPATEIEDMLNHDSGLAGMAGDNDMRRVLAAHADGDPDAALALDVYCHRIKSYVGAYYAQLGRVDAITFTAGVGEHNPLIRQWSLAGLQRLGIEVDPERNHANAALISPPDAEVAVCVIATDEQREIAEQALATVGSPASPSQ